MCARYMAQHDGHHKSQVHEKSAPPLDERSDKDIQEEKINGSHLWK